MFLPLSLATLGNIPKEDISKATGFYSLTRQLGGSIGVALLTTLLTRRENFHRSVLIEKVSANSQLALDRLSSFRRALPLEGLHLRRGAGEGDVDARPRRRFSGAGHVLLRHLVATGVLISCHCRSSFCSARARALRPSRITDDVEHRALQR